MRQPDVADDATFSNLSKELNEKQMSDYYGILFMSSMEKGNPFVLPDPTLGADICIHCGGIIRHDDEGKHKKSHKHTSRREYLYRKAKESSIKKYH